jgi:hypothetical protein
MQTMKARDPRKRPGGLHIEEIPSLSRVPAKYS